MKTFFTWLESLGWQSALCFAIGLAIGLCVFILLVDVAIRKHAEKVELRQIRERLWEENKRRVQYLLEAQREREEREEDEDQLEFVFRLKSRDLTQMRERRFHLPAAFRDMKGTTKQ
jgi:hypothetical protein